MPKTKISEKHPPKTARATAEVSGYVQDVDRAVMWGRVQFTRHDGTTGERLVPRGELRMHGKIRDVLDPQGVNYFDRDLDRIVAAHTIDSAKVKYGYSDVGWRASRRFGLPGRVIHEDGHDLEIMPIPEDGPLAVYQQHAGDLKAWNEDTVPAIAASSFAAFSVGVAFAGPLLRFSSATEGVTFAFSGEEGVGKTTCCVAAQAVMGNPDRHLLPSWDASRAGVKDLLGDLCDVAWIIDDTSRDSLPAAERLRFWTDVGHAIAGGGKRNVARSYQAQHGATAVRRPAMALTSGEIAPDELAKLTGAPVMGGVKVRFVDIPLPPKADGGAFDLAVKDADPAAITGLAFTAAENLQAALTATYGVAFNPFLDYLESRYEELPDLVRRIESSFVKNVKKARKPNAPALNRRVARKFGLVQAGLYLAIEAGSLDITRVQARRAVRVCYNAAMKRARRDKKARSAQVRILKAVLRDPEQVPRLDRGQDPTRTNLGFRRKLNGAEIGYMRADQIGDALELDEGGVRALVAYLSDRGRLLPGTGGDRTRPVLVAGRPVRHYAFPESFFAKRKKPKPTNKRSTKRARKSG